MSGHSKWSTIKRQKGLADQKRGMTFTKIAGAIALAAKLGGSGDLETNPRLKMALLDAKNANMPKENISRAIDRGLGKLPGQTFDEIHFEGFGPAKAAFIVTGATDNKNRTLAEIKNIFERSGGHLGSTGSAAFMFDKVGEIKVVSSGSPKDEEILALIDCGAEDVEDFEEDDTQKYFVITEVSKLAEVSKNITQNHFMIESADIIYKPNTTINIADKEQAEKVIHFASILEEHDDIQKVFSNFEIPENLLSNG